MPGLKNRFMDEVLRVVRRYMRLEICAIYDIHWHETANDKKFNSVDVIMRDRAKKESETPIRKQLPVLQHFLGGHGGGYNWTPRIGDLVWVFFYGGRQGIVLGSAWSWAEYPVCRPSPYDIADKNGRWMKPYQDSFGDFPKQPYPELRKPYCFRWFHGPVKGYNGPGRDWCFLFDYCRLGNTSAACEMCKTIDSIARLKNHYLKFYSEETESRKAYPLRGEYHAPCGSFWMFESKDRPSTEYVSEIHTEGEGYWTVQGAKIENGVEVLKGHIRHSPSGTIEVLSATTEDYASGSLALVQADDDSSFTDVIDGDIAAELQHLPSTSRVRIYKSGKIQIVSCASKIIKSVLSAWPDGYCEMWNAAANAYVEIAADGAINISPKTDKPVTINGNVNIIGDLTVNGTTWAPIGENGD